ncbi:hypothetical protein BCL57_002292 [Agromyces flavus]|uniref:Uncharacterized protein n=1 Tax=Agromyces flavus TaxID=589382 RepID=A0A1H1UXF3_9MICO|nr:hypothetical protein [Agromyces flavus]MCP2368119.1 hypothetical protein [Agromyces flavus]GGI47580.1 hypothetical protein GCM10010932_22680 [Agromyces flavus]SDS77143.1 hypothetical protein SAMN04489721_1881 [Agromyces flavus]
MSELAHGAMLVGALGGAACAVGGRRTALDVAASAAMLVAMTDMAFTRFVAALAWTAVLAGFGIALGTRLRPTRGAHGAPLSPGRRGHALHRALAFIVGAWAFVAADGGSGAGASEAGHAHAGTELLFVAATMAMTAFGGWLVAVELRNRRRARSSGPADGSRGWARHAAEAASTTVMLAAMAVPGVLAALA